MRIICTHDHVWAHRCLCIHSCTCMHLGAHWGLRHLDFLLLRKLLFHYTVKMEVSNSFCLSSRQHQMCHDFMFSNILAVQHAFWHFGLDLWSWVLDQLDLYGPGPLIILKNILRICSRTIFKKHITRSIQQTCFWSSVHFKYGPGA